MPGNRSSLVWVERPERANALTALEPAEFVAELERALQGSLGAIQALGQRIAYPLEELTVDAYSRGRVALVGEAAHVFPPIGAQGLNLGLRDVEDLVSQVTKARERTPDVGDPSMLAAYNRSRSLDAISRTRFVGVLNGTLTSGSLPLQLLRGLTLHAFQAAPPLKRAAMRMGMSGPRVPALSLLDRASN
jgi:2-octaprenyl-6-methoxyphenol hydroxylase